MGELRRIVCQKKYLLAVFVLLIANLFLFQYYQMDNLQALRDKETRQDTLDVWQEEQETAGLIDFYDGRYYLAKADSEEE